MGLITEERFVELIEKIPVMQEKLDRILSALKRMEESNNLKGFKRDIESDPFDFDKSRVEQDEASIEVMNTKRAESERLKQEADAIERELDL